MVKHPAKELDEAAERSPPGRSIPHSRVYCFPFASVNLLPEPASCAQVPEVAPAAAPEVVWDVLGATVEELVVTEDDAQAALEESAEVALEEAEEVEPGQFAMHLAESTFALFWPAAI